MPRTKSEKAKMKSPTIGIPPTEYRESKGILYVTFRQLESYHTWDQIQAFDEWFEGQTGILLEDGTQCIYAHDYERWRERGMPCTHKENQRYATTHTPTN